MRRLLGIVVVAALAIAAAGCGGKTAPRVAGTPGSSVSPPDAASLLPGGTPGASTTGPSPGTSGGPAAARTPGPSPSPITLDWESTLPVEASITPACVQPGGSATIVIRTGPTYAVAYHAVYAGTKGGAPPPYGYSYGGNDKGHAGEDGVYRSTWTVSANAPSGPARADVIVGDGEAWGYDDPPFAVAGATGTC